MNRSHLRLYVIAFLAYAVLSSALLGLRNGLISTVALCAIAFYASQRSPPK